jgi:putative transposase
MKRYTQEEIDAVGHLLHAAKDRVIYRKLLAVHLHMKGHSNLHIASMLGLNKNTVGVYIQSFSSRGAEGLVPKKSPGRPKLLSDGQEQELYETIKGKTPDDVGFSGVMNWTAKIACGWVYKEFGVQYSNTGMLELFHRLKLSYTRPTYVLAKADPERQKQFIEDFEAVKKTPERGDRPYPL